MRLAILSDLHLGRGDSTDRFGHDVPRFHRFLDFLETQGDEVVLLGDVMDTHHGTVPFDFWREARAICATYAGLVDRLIGGRYRVVAGNHDDCLAGLPGVAEEHAVEADGHRVLLRHGHQFDRLIRTAPRVCAAGNWAAGRCAAVGLTGALRFLDWFDDFANGVTKDRGLIYREHAIAYGRDKGTDIVVLAHLHQQDLHREAGVTYLNVGACLQGRFEYGIVDTRTSLAEARQWV